MNGTRYAQCGMDGMRDYQSSAHCKDEPTIDLDISKQDGIRRQEESSGSGVVGTKSNSKARSSRNSCLGR